MRTRKKRKAAVLASTLALLLAVPQVVSAAQVQTAAPQFTVNASTVAFAGHEWWVVGNDTTGIYQQPDSVTLLAKGNDFGKSVFRTGGGEFEGSTYDSANKLYYANNPDGTSWNEPTEYAGSTLQQTMATIAAGFSAKELTGQGPDSAGRRHERKSQCRRNLRAGDHTEIVGFVQGRVGNHQRQHRPQLWGSISAPNPSALLWQSQKSQSGWRFKLR